MHAPNSAKTTLRSPRGVLEMSVAAGLTIAGVFLVLSRAAGSGSGASRERSGQ